MPQSKYLIAIVSAYLSIVPSSTAALAQPQVGSVQPSASHLPLRIWGAETLGQVHANFYLPSLRLYGEEIAPGRGTATPAFLWPSTVQLSALAAAARAEPAVYLEPLKTFAAALRTYRTAHNNIVGLDVWPAPKPHDRYYDDNAWALLALIEVYRLTQDPRDLEFASEIYRFVMSGEDDAAGGGIYWHEGRRKSKHACSAAPAAVGAMKLYQITRDEAYLQAGMRLYAWMNNTLADSDALFSDNIQVEDGAVDRKKWSYNTAMMIRANSLLFEISTDRRYLDEAVRLAAAAEKQWVRPSDGLIADEAKFAHKLLEAFLHVYDVDQDQRWLTIVARCLKSLRDTTRDPNGWYDRRWDSIRPPSLDPIRLADQASAARAFWVAAVYDIPAQHP